MEEWSSSIWIYFRSGGWLMVPLVVITFMIWYSYFHYLFLLSSRICRPGISDLCHLVENSGTNVELEFQGGAPDVVRHTGILMSSGNNFYDSFVQAKAAEMGRFSYAFYILGALVTAAPLSGLLGTVIGMVDTFKAVGAAEKSTDSIADGISQALVTTQAGLVSALVGTFALAHLYRLYRKLQNEIEVCESYLALRYAHGRDEK